MARDRALKIWVDGITAARLALKAEEAGTTISEYVGELIVRDANQGGRADALATEVLETQYLTAILLRALLGRSLGDSDADKLVERARAKAHDEALAAVADLQQAPAAKEA